MSRIFLNVKDAVVAMGYRGALTSCGADVVDCMDVADFVLEDDGTKSVRILSRSGMVISVLQKPIDFSSVVQVLERTTVEVPLWEGCPVLVNLSAGVAKCVVGENAGQKVSLTDLQQKLLGAVIPAGRDGILFDDLCMVVYGKVDVWAKSNLDMVIYNLNKRLAGVMGKPKVIAKNIVGKGRVAFVF